MSTLPKDTEISAFTHQYVIYENFEILLDSSTLPRFCLNFECFRGTLLYISDIPSEPSFPNVSLKNILNLQRQTYYVYLILRLTIYNRRPLT